MATNITADENLPCEECGRFGAIDFGSRKLCPDCYAHSGSCCSEMGCESSGDEQD